MNQKITQIDPNFKVETGSKEFAFYISADEEPMQFYGVFREGNCYRRMPEAVAKSVSSGVADLHKKTAGGRVRFKTDSKRIEIKAVLDNPCIMPHFAMTGSMGMDLYEKSKAGYRYITTVIPSPEPLLLLDKAIDLPTDVEMHDLTLNLPLYAEVKEIYIGFEKEARVEQADDYLPFAPIVYYGSSITQGGCASRPGCSYPAILSRRFDRDYINLGFSGNAKAEDAMIDYICTLDTSLFVLDYDHNSPSPDHLATTCKKMFEAMRSAHPNLPILLMSRPKYFLTPEEQQRRDAIYSIYKNAVSSGDSNVYFLDGKELMSPAGDEGTVDGCHPTDFGFASMANAVGAVMEQIFQKETR